MANTFVKIASVTVGASGSSSIDFSSIPATYTDLKIFLSGRHTGATASSLALKINGATTNYSSRWLQANGSSSAAASDTGSPLVATFGSIPGTNSTTNTFSNDSIYISNYSGSSSKSILNEGAQENNASAAYSSLIVNLWSSSSAITSISLYPYDLTNFVQYSTATLYGIKKS